MMLKIFAIIGLFLSFSSAAYTQESKTKTVLIDDKLLLVVPAGFGQPTETASKGSSKNRAGLLLHKQNDILFTYDLGDSNDPNTQEVSDNDVHEWADKQLDRLKQKPGFFYLDDGIFLQDGKNIGFIKYILKDPGSSDSYQLLFFTSMNNVMVQFEFSCPAKMRRNWEPVADRIANSLRLTSPGTSQHVL